VCELLAREAAQCFDQEVLICRFFSVFGVRQHRLLVWELYQRLAGSEETIALEGTGEESRDFLHVDDLAAALLQLIEGRLANRQSGRCLAINIAGGEEASVKTIAELIRTILGSSKEIRYRRATRPGDPLRWCADITRLRSLLPAWQPRALETGLRQCIGEWQKEGALSAHGS
jgi:UDP-glucose 4-epimerase